tara:strand:- start:830 stop:1213 length:384 start_codon:yes stop_codon:yes gene_type:complete
MPEIISTPNALVQTTNGKRFYCYSGSIGVTTTETEMITVDNIGERDIFLKFQVGSLGASSIDTQLRVYSNDVIIFETVFSVSAVEYINDSGVLEFVLPLNSKLKITLKNDSGASTIAWTVAGHGKFV